MTQNRKGPPNGFKSHEWGDPPTETMFQLPEADRAGLDAYHEQWDHVGDWLLGSRAGLVTYYYAKRRLVRVDIFFNFKEVSERRSFLERLTQEWGQPWYDEPASKILEMKPSIDRIELSSHWTSQDGTTDAWLSSLGSPLLMLTDKPNYEIAISHFWQHGRDQPS